MKHFFTLITGLVISFNVSGQKKNSEKPLKLSDSSSIAMPQVIIIGKRDGMINKVPGSGNILNQKEIKLFSPVSLNEVLRKVSGVNVVDEEGAGLRVNIGIRGLDPDRSRNILMLEDGVPIALGPYGEPEMYFTPSIDKMAGIEILKGSGQILHGPQTIGGIVNFFTADPPFRQTTRIKLMGAKNGYFSGFGTYGNTIGKTGFIISYLHKRADELGPTRFRLNDLSAKIKISLDSNSSLGIKLGYYEEESNSTYLGLTQTMFDKGDQDFIRMSASDKLPIKRYSVSATHQLQINQNISLKTTAFAYTTSRNWQRQDFSFNSAAANQTGIIWGDPGISNGAVYMINSTGNRNRQFVVAGLEPRLSIKHRLLNIDNELETGARFLYEKADEQFIIGKDASSSEGTMRDKELRTGNAFSAYIQNKFNITSKLSVSGGMRIENFDYERQILRGRYRINNVNNVIRDTSIIASDNTFAIIPGAGLTFAASDNINLFAGVHKGFAPPRIKDAITSNGVPYNLDAELSTNYELGTRMHFGNFASAELTGFILNFQNQIIPVSNSSGNLNSTGVVNGGQTLHKGIEAAFKIDLGEISGSRHSFTVESNITLQKSEYNNDRFIPVKGQTVNVKNNQLPYSAKLMVWNAIGMDLQNGFGFRVSGNYISAQFTDELNTELASANGRTGKIDSRFVVDANAFYNIPKTKAAFNVAVKNLTNQRYITTRRPEGIRVSLPRMLTAGFEVNF
ncbi:Fe(3+) dicitrate transport protein [Pedobacter sp. CG_S7]|uniref:TonB-dependent receptor family protein n=1 Tax=Pedobacter sp. CG_S7 TaxID=3143930 RepID=UPI00339A7CBA